MKHAQLALERWGGERDEGVGRGRGGKEGKTAGGEETAGVQEKKL